MYQCINSSKCISTHRLMDTINDCPYGDDENFTLIITPDIIKQLEKTHFKCQTSGKYIPRSLVKNGYCNCPRFLFVWCEDEDEDIIYLYKNIVFQHICDGFVDLSPVLITGRNETDETECEQWQCNNIYTRCNDVWNCLNGADEAGCVSTSTLNCSSKQHLCGSPDTNQFTCLPIEKANDGNVDCLGGTDEPELCGTRTQIGSSVVKLGNDFYCMNQSSQTCIDYLDLCNERNDCEHGDDEQFCLNQTVVGCDLWFLQNDFFFFDIKQFLCSYRVPSRDWKMIHFTLDRVIKAIEHRTKNIENTIFSSSSAIPVFDQHKSHCHRGLDLRIWLNNTSNLTTNTCLCPPSYYGDRCQYQNQRVSLTIKFQAPSDSWQTLFAIIISLIDDNDQQIIHSYEQFTYLSIRDCQMKFNVYLLYSTRPKDPTKNYSIHIDIYEKVSLIYRGSLLFPIVFPFLPVYRIALIADIPRSNDKTQICSNALCLHGKCIRYSNNLRNMTFCQCHEGWSGQFCTIQHTCNCSVNALCIGVSANNRSICVCPLHTFGPRCLLLNTTCSFDDNSICQNGGECIPNNDYTISNRKIMCVCRQGFSGDRCETVDYKLILSFGKDVVLSQSIFIHFIEVIDILNAPVRSTTFKTIPVRQESVDIYWSRPFHLVFIEIFNKTYYLAVIQKIYNRSKPIIKTISSLDGCPNINEVLNETIARLHLLRRIKYYHLPCQTYSPNLQCFHDDVHLCICDDFGQQQRLANCFKFDHNMTFDCLGQSECENNGQCFQDNPSCPKRSICFCPPCFYGRRCQFSTSGFGLSLDAILGYHIQPHLSLVQQSFIVQFSLAFTIIFILAGLVNGILSLMTFKNKTTREVGCGLYLLGSSITTLLITMMFGLKFLILLLAQMEIISNRSFLLFQCHSFDFILRVCLCMDQWLNACVAFERAMTAIKATGFVKKKSKQAAKFVIIILLIFIIGTCVHDSIYRHLIDEENDDDTSQKRIWCIVSYPFSFEVYNYIVHILHFFGPFIINIISVIILITKQSGRKSNMDAKRSYREHLREQYRQHKHLLIAPIVLVILALPRLIITFVSKCMQSANDSWLFLIGYFISFIPPMLTFVVFILPSKSYRKELHQSVGQLRRTIQRCLHCI